MLRKAVKILHTVGACGMVGAMVGALALIAFAPQETPRAYADMRLSVAVLADYILLPSLGITLVSGLVSMAVHTPYLSKGWALVKAAFGIIMFKGVLHLVGAMGQYAEELDAALTAVNAEAAGPPAGALAHEGLLLWTMLVLSVANIVFGVWRPRLAWPTAAQSDRVAEPSAAAEDGAAAREPWYNRPRKS
jgi:uncharacterized membrane protein